MYCTNLENQNKKSLLVSSFSSLLFVENFWFKHGSRKTKWQLFFCFFFFFWYNVFLTIGKCRFSDCVTHNLVISRIDRPSLVDFRFNSLNRNFSLYALYKSWKIHNKKYLRDFTNHYNLLLFFLNWGLCCLQLLFFI